MKKHSPKNISAVPEYPTRLLISILAITAIVFIPSLTNGFVNWDDPEYITKNPYIKKIDITELFGPVYVLAHYHPLTLLSYALEYHFFGLNPFFYHLTNLLLHLANTWLVFQIIYFFSKKNKWVTVLTAILFGIHPMHVESVAWISERKDLLYVFFYLMALWQYLIYNERPTLKRLIPVFLLFLFSLFSKAQAVTLPVVLLLIDWHLKRKFTLKTWLEKVPFFAAAVIFGIIAIYAHEEESSINPNFYSSFQSVFWAGYALSMYLIKSLLPFNLCGAHPYPFLENFRIPWYVYLSPVYVIPFFYFLFYSWKRNQWYWFGSLFFLIQILPMLRFLPVGDILYADRYSYLSYLGLFFCISIFAVNHYNKISTTWKKIIMRYSVLLILLIYSVISFQRNKTWNNSLVFWSDVAVQYPNYWRGHHCVGQAWLEKGKNSSEKGDVVNAKIFFTKALENYNRAIDSDPYAPPVPYLWRGAIYAEHLIHYDLAIENFRKAVEIGEKNNQKDQSYIEALQSLGLCYQWKGLPREALVIYNKLEAMSATDSHLYFLRGLSYTSLGRLDSAVYCYSNAIQRDPQNVKAYLNRGVIFTDQTNQYTEGIRDFENVLRLDPNNIQAINNLGVAYFKQGNFALALNYYTNSLTLNPNQGNVYYLRALAYEQTRELAKAYQDGLMAQRLGVAVPGEVMGRWGGGIMNDDF